MRTMLILMFALPLFAGVNEDIAALKQKAQDFYVLHGRYFKGDWTPATIPTQGDTLAITKMRKQPEEPEQFIFTPTAKDWQYRVIHWTRKINFPDVDGIAPLFEEGYRIVARQKDGEGKVTEIMDGMLAKIGTPAAPLILPG